MLKFRVWVKEHNYFVRPESHGYMSFGCHMNGKVIQFGLDNAYVPFSENGEKYIIQRFTGKLDINKKEIYEGDIIKVSELDHNQNPGPGKRRILQTFEKAIVTWDKNMLAYTYNPIRKVGANIPHQMLCYGYEPEIIGNIFENSELLENKEKIDGK